MGSSTEQSQMERADDLIDVLDGKQRHTQSWNVGTIGLIAMQAKAHSDGAWGLLVEALRKDAKRSQKAQQAG